MKTIGVTGGVGAGKTTVLNHLENKYNAKILVADNIAKFLEEPGQPCYNKLLDYFGEEILNQDRTINNKEFARVLFASDENREVVNGIIHPEVKKYILNEIALGEENNLKCLVVEAALLIEEGYDKILDEMWYVYADEDVRRNRLIESRGYSNEKIDSIMKSQLSDQEFRSKCKWVIDNSGSEQDTINQIDSIMGE